MDMDIVERGDTEDSIPACCTKNPGGEVDTNRVRAKTEEQSLTEFRERFKDEVRFASLGNVDEPRLS